MNRIDFRKVFYLFLILIFWLSGNSMRCSKRRTHAHGDMAPVKTYPKDYVHPLTEINLEKVVNENRGLRVLEENATTVHDYYRGSVQEKAEGERLLKEGKWEEAVNHFEKSNKFLRVVLRYFSEDEAYRNIYGDHVVIFLAQSLDGGQLPEVDHHLQEDRKGRQDRFSVGIREILSFLLLKARENRMGTLRSRKDLKRTSPKK